MDQHSLKAVSYGIQFQITHGRLFGKNQPRTGESASDDQLNMIEELLREAAEKEITDQENDKWEKRLSSIPRIATLKFHCFLTGKSI